MYFQSYLMFLTPIWIAKQVKNNTLMGFVIFLQLFTKSLVDS